MASGMSVFQVARLRRPALLGLYFRTVLHGNGTGAGRDVARVHGTAYPRTLTAAILTARGA
jgi:hypothetical protein